MFLLAPGSAVFLSIAIKMRQIAFEMYQIVFGMKLRMRRRKWIFGAGATPPTTSTCPQCTSVLKWGKRLLWPRAWKHVVAGAPNVPGRD